MKTALLCVLLLAQEPKKESAEYPTFEPFTASRMFPMFGDPRTADLEKLARNLKSTHAGYEAGKAAGEEYAPPRSSTASALLVPEVAPEQRALAPLAPVVLMKLEPLWSLASWSAEQVSTARSGVELLAALGAPKPTFAAGKDAENHAGLEQLVRWFRAEVAKPERRAAMIFTLDDGPFVGLPYEATAVLPATATKALDEHVSLALCRVERAREPWVLQAVRDGKALWSRVLSGAPDESVKEAVFLDKPAERLGPYGWKVQMTVTWSQGKELAEVFLDPEAKLLFYFLSW